jgi:hypothetical protein
MAEGQFAGGVGISVFFGAGPGGAGLFGRGGRLLDGDVRRFRGFAGLGGAFFPEGGGLTAVCGLAFHE